MEYVNKYELGMLDSAYEYFGAHKSSKGYIFRVYAPNATKVSIIGSFNSFRPIEMKLIDNLGVYEIELEVAEFDEYLYKIVTTEEVLYKADPYAFFSTLRPNTHSYVFDISKLRRNTPIGINKQDPVVIYELHLGSFNLASDYSELAKDVVKHVLEFGFTHVELLPITEHPMDESWGYQNTGYFSPTSRYGSPHGLSYFISECHKNNIGVILDWVPGHFVADKHGLGKFDGTDFYERSDEFRINEWGSLNTDFSKGVSVSFMLSSANFFIEYYGIDGIRVDAVNNILYEASSSGVENKHGIEFLKKLNKLNTVTFAEDSSIYNGVTDKSKLNFDYKWSLGYMNTTLKFFEKEEVHRKFHMDELLHLFSYAYSEDFLLEYSHDEVVHLKKSMLNKMPGDVNNKLANLRMLLGLMFSFPGKKLLFMGTEFAQSTEWDCLGEIEWNANEVFSGYLKELINYYKSDESLYRTDFNGRSLELINVDKEQCVIAFKRTYEQSTYIIINLIDNDFTYHLPGNYVVDLSSDATEFGGNGIINKGDSLKDEFLLPKLSIIFVKEVE